jgi:glycerol-3-phosphate acyltransferase PlsY
MTFIILITVSYLLGSIPFGLIIAAAHGKNLRSVGSGNIGATNVSRALGKKWAWLCFALDVLKGLLPMLVARRFITFPATSQQLAIWLVVGCAAIFGHIFPVYLKFKGGKGVATSLGVVLGLWPYYTICGLVAFAVWALVLFVWRYVSLASIAAAVAFPVCLITAVTVLPDWHFNTLWPLFVVAVIMPVLVVFRHRANIKRLIEGTESKILQKQSPVCH